MITGSQLRILRQIFKLTQEELSIKMNLAQQRIAALEKIEKELSPDIITNALAALHLTKDEALRILESLPLSAGGRT